MGFASGMRKAVDAAERGIEGAVNGVFARAFKGEVQPVEIAARLQKEIDHRSVLLSRERKLVPPNEFSIELSEHDYNRLTPPTGAASPARSSAPAAARQGHGYVFNGPIRLQFELDNSLHTGHFRVRSEAVADSRSPQRESSTAIRTAELVLEVNGMRHPLVPPGIVIGRGERADLRINDPGISRQHAEIQVTDTQYGRQYRIQDLGSRNGIKVDGQRVTQAELHAGTRLEIGSTRLLVHSPPRDADACDRRHAAQSSLPGPAVDLRDLLRGRHPYRPVRPCGAEFRSAPGVGEATAQAAQARYADPGRGGRRPPDRGGLGPTPRCQRPPR